MLHIFKLHAWSVISCLLQLNAMSMASELQVAHQAILGKAPLPTKPYRDHLDNLDPGQGAGFNPATFKLCCDHAGKSHVAPLVEEMLQRLNSEVNRYDRVITFWHQFGPDLEAAVCTVLRETTAAVTRQCGLVAVVSSHQI